MVRRFVHWSVGVLLAYLGASWPVHAQSSALQRAIVQGQTAARDSAQAHYVRAARFAAEGRYGPAISAIRRAMEFLPNEQQLRVDLAALLVASGDKEGARRELRTLADQTPPYPPAIIQLGDMSIGEGDTATARRHYTRLTTGVEPFPLAFLRLGDIAQEQGKREEAVRQYRKACHADSLFVEAWLSLGSILVIMDRHTEALQAFDKAVQIAPQEPVPGELRRLALQRKQEYEEGTAAGKMRARIIVTETRQEALALRREVLAGADFIALASRHSIDPTAEVGGDLGFFAEGELIPAFEQAVRSMRPGETSEVIQLPTGYAIIRRVN